MNKVFVSLLLLFPLKGWTTDANFLSTPEDTSIRVGIAPPLDSVKTGASSAPVHRGYVGMGLGIPYGVVGLNAEFCINPKNGGSLYLTAGVGHSLVQGIAYNGGMNIYLRHADVVWRPRLSLLYGINGALESPPSSIYRGVSAGAGQLFLLGKRKRLALSFDVLFLVSSGLFDKLENSMQDYQIRGFRRVKFSLGIKGLLQ